MNETQEEIRQLQDLLDMSYANAGDHLKKIQLESLRLGAVEVVAQLSGACICDLATVDRIGAPYVAPVDVLFVKGKAWFSSAPNSLRFKNIQADPRVSLARTVGSEISVLIHGNANLIDTSAGNYEFLHRICIETYGDTYDSWGLWGNPWAWIEPKRMFASRLPSG